MRKQFRWILTIFIITVGLQNSNSQEVGTHKEMDQKWQENVNRKEVVQQWQDMGFGMFIHWEASSELQGKWQGQEKTKDLWGEWIMNRAGISVSDYEKATKSFNPDQFNADHWTKLAADAGMKYMVITAKHHDGFAMYPSKASKYNILDHCGFERDPLKELSKACEKNDIAYGFYYSHRLDWHARDIYGYKKPSDDNFEKYWSEKCMAQVNELTTGYGPLGVMWFDLGYGNKEKVKSLSDMVLKNQPNVMVNSRIGSGSWDYKSLRDCQIPLLPVTAPSETCMTLNQHWARYPQDTEYKNARDIIQMLAGVRARGANLLLNIGPDNKGRIPLRETKVLKEIGQWMTVFSESIHGVQASPLGPLPWGECTQKGNKLYLHVFDLPVDGTLSIPGLKTEIKKAYFMGAPNVSAIKTTRTKYGVELSIDPTNVPAVAFHPDNTVLVLEFAQEPKADQTLCLDHDFDNVFGVVNATVGKGIERKTVRLKKPFPPEHVGERYAYHAKGFTSPEADLKWVFRNDRLDGYYIVVEYISKQGDGKQSVSVEVGGSVFTKELPATDGKLGKFNLGTVVLDDEKLQTLRLFVNGPVLDKELEIKSVTLVPSHIHPPYPN